MLVPPPKVTLDLTTHLPIQDPVLEPFPSWEMQEVGNCDKLQYTQSMEIDNNGLMWIIDTGRIGIFTGSPDNTCPPKLVIIDTETGETVDSYVFPDSVAPYDSVFLNDIVVDNTRNIAIITDMTGVVDGKKGGLIVFNRTTRSAARFYDETMDPELGLSWNFQGRDLGEDAFAQPVNAVTLTPDATRLLYGPLQGLSVYSVLTDKLFTNAADWKDSIVDHGDWQGSTDGMTVCPSLFMCQSFLLTPCQPYLTAHSYCIYFSACLDIYRWTVQEQFTIVT